jgi:cytochrome c biogenesis protein CcmG/thiol:disulfide interchange protein DsbE
MDAMRIQAPAAGRRRFGSDRVRTIIVLVIVGLGLVGAALLMEQPWANGGFTNIDVSGGGTGPAPKVGAVAPDFQATTTDGEPVSLSDFKGQPVWLTFGASWCPDCRAEAPDIQATYEKFAPQGLVVLGVAVDEDDAAATAYAERVGFTFPQVADPQTRIAAQYRLMGTPTHYFIDASGVIREVRLGGLPPAEMEQLVSTILR